ncbi:MAG: 2TM domain-containing protein [Saprospiraceae bacterium]|nr:2TM domain-containing protein [Saprospiraceae bacterium]
MDSYRKAQSRVNNRKKFLWHAFFFVPICFLLFVINLSTDDANPWSLFIIFPWAFVLFVHFVITFVFPSLNVFSSDWDDLQMERELERLEGRDYLPGPEYERYLNEEGTFTIRSMEKIKAGFKEEDFV